MADDDTLLLDSSEVRGGGDRLARRIPLCNGHFFIIHFKCVAFFLVQTNEGKILRDKNTDRE